MPRVRVGDCELFVADEGRGPPLLLVHGFPLDHAMWKHQIKAFARDCRVIAPDLRGFGQSDVTPGVVSMEQFADDLAALLDALGVSEPVTFCGLSMGGCIAWQFWIRHAPRLSRLVLCDTRAIADSDEVARGRRVTAERVLQEGPAVVADAMLGRLFCEATCREQPELVVELRRVIFATNSDGIAAALRGMAQRPDVTARLAEINLPTLVLCGEHDEISPVPEMRGIAEKIPAAEFVVVPNAGHMAPLEQPACVNDALGRFLRS